MLELVLIIDNNLAACTLARVLYHTSLWSWDLSWHHVLALFKIVFSKLVRAIDLVLWWWLLYKDLLILVIWTCIDLRSLANHDLGSGTFTLDIHHLKWVRIWLWLQRSLRWLRLYLLHFRFSGLLLYKCFVYQLLPDWLLLWLWLPWQFKFVRLF